MKKGLFLIHGFMENANETFELFINELEKYENIEYEANDLQGHSLNEDINDFNYKKCVKKIEKQYVKFKSKYSEVIIIGFSMGGVIASYLASKYSCTKLILLTPAFRYIRNTRLGKDLVSIVSKEQISKFRNRFNKEHKVKNALSIVKEKYGNIDIAIYDIFAKSKGDITINPFREFIFLVERLKRNINIKDIPTRIYIGENDELVPVDGALEIFRKIECVDKRMIVLPNIYHRILKSSIYKEISNEIIEFINKD